MALQYITEEDLRVIIKERHELQIVEGNQALIPVAEQSAIERIKSSLRIANYDVDAIFNANGNNRNAWLVTICCDITLYLLLKRIDQKLIPQIREDSYKEAITWLERLADGKEAPSLPKLTEENSQGNTVSKSRIRFGSEPRLPHRY